MKKRRIKKVLKWILIGSGLVGLTCFVLICVFFYLVFFGPPATRTRNIKKYEDMYKHTNGLQTAYIVFPESIPEGTLDTDYYYYYRDTWNTATYEVFLQCKYDDKTFEQEFDRLRSTAKTYGGTKKYLKYDNGDNYPYPAYIANENAAHNYEYAMLTGDNEITYICTGFIEPGHTHFDKKYLPKDFMTDEGRKFGSGFSIYYESVNSQGFSTYFTREPVEEVTKGHMRNIQNHSFCVHTRLDDRNHEIITDCTFYYSENPGDDSIETEYHDLDGFEYKDLALNKERDHAIVTYLKDGQEKQLDLELPLRKK